MKAEVVVVRSEPGFAGTREDNSRWPLDLSYGRVFRVYWRMSSDDGRMSYRSPRTACRTRVDVLFFWITKTNSIHVNGFRLLGQDAADEPGSCRWIISFGI